MDTLSILLYIQTYIYIYTCYRCHTLVHLSINFNLIWFHDLLNCSTNITKSHINSSFLHNYKTISNMVLCGWGFMTSRIGKSCSSEHIQYNPKKISSYVISDVQKRIKKIKKNSKLKNFRCSKRQCPLKEKTEIREAENNTWKSKFLAYQVILYERYWSRKGWSKGGQWVKEVQ